ncbi:predicted protein [Sclerotinia sclerotiorum 1980 UF-70]|uniref:Uncharacterized protein n=1 Tax=Sclerotinia sclerotiorum (strain ATCC 18683 / 1980 / Ss-1) TaxID=665079 RepID=A7F6A7_SCLS1|nr:predicted protein [Sclerotinia sclerotiorum 1980 UF-70]EDN98278.1 predicted protein [Sclerotinia sclerotiorum 1980 UF-70]
MVAVAVSDYTRLSVKEFYQRYAYHAYQNPWEWFSACTCRSLQRYYYSGESADSRYIYNRVRDLLLTENHGNVRIMCGKKLSNPLYSGFLHKFLIHFVQYCDREKKPTDT